MTLWNVEFGKILFESCEKFQLFLNLSEPTLFNKLNWSFLTNWKMNIQLSFYLIVLKSNWTSNIFLMSTIRVTTHSKTLIKWYFRVIERCSILADDTSLLVTAVWDKMLLSPTSFIFSRLLLVRETTWNAWWRWK